jgi:hypothetical protein
VCVCVCVCVCARARARLFYSCVVLRVGRNFATSWSPNSYQMCLGGLRYWEEKKNLGPTKGCRVIYKIISNDYNRRSQYPFSMQQHLVLLISFLLDPNVFPILALWVSSFLNNRLRKMAVAKDGNDITWMY